jgi:hypothetical protein
MSRRVVQAERDGAIGNGHVAPRRLQVYLYESHKS